MILNSGSILSQWELSTLINDGSVYGIAVDSNEVAVVGYNLSDSTKGIYYSKNFGTTWEYHNTDYEGYNNMVLHDGFLFYGYGVEAGGVNRSNDYGKSWEKLLGLPNEGVGELNVIGENLFASMMSDYGGVGVWKSSDYGETWTESWKGTGSSSANLTLTNIDSLFFVGTYGYGVVKYNRLSAEWSQVNSGLPEKITILSIIGLNNKLFAATQLFTDSLPEYKVYYSDNLGNNWNPMRNEEFNFGLFRTKLLSDGENIFLQGFKQLWWLPENDSTWKNITHNLPDEIFNSIAVVGDNLMVGVDNKGLWQTSIENIVTVTTFKYLTYVDSEFTLMQNYPNPFNPSTIIKYQISNNKSQINSKSKSSNRVMLKVFDILGREVATLVNEKQKPGNYEVVWNATNQPSGIYYYQIKFGYYTKTMKMILMK